MKFAIRLYNSSFDQKNIYILHNTIIIVLSINTEKNEELTEKFIREVENIQSFLKELPVRNIPRKVILGDVPHSLCPRSFVNEDSMVLIIDKNLKDEEIYAIIKREAFIRFLPDADFPELYDLAWFYSGNLNLWMKCPSRLILRTMPMYRAPEDFLSIDPEDSQSFLKSTIKTLLHHWKARGKIDARTYLKILATTKGYPAVRLSKKEIKTLNAIMYTLLDEGESKVERIAVKSGQSAATVSRALRNLVSKGVIVGPYALYHFRLGLSSYLIELEDPDEEELNFLDAFPFTYSAIVTSSDTYYINLLVPNHLEGKFRNLSGSGIKIGKRIGWSFDMVPESQKPELVLERMLDAYESSGDTPLSAAELLKAQKPPIQLDEKDMLALKEVEERGRVSRDEMRMMGIPNPAERFAKYRKAGLVVKGYFPTGLGIGEGVIMRINVPFKDFLRVKNALSSASSVVVFFTEGGLYGVTSLSLVSEKLIGPLIRAAKLVFGDSLERIEIASMIVPSNWHIPVELWNVEEQRFEMNVDEFMKAFSRRLRS